MLIVTIMVIVIITTPRDGGVRPISCMYTKCRLCAIYDTGKESLSFRKVKKLIF